MTLGLFRLRINDTGAGCPAPPVSFLRLLPHGVGYSLMQRTE